MHPLIHLLPTVKWKKWKDLWEILRLAENMVHAI